MEEELDLKLKIKKQNFISRLIIRFKLRRVFK